MFTCIRTTAGLIIAGTLLAGGCAGRGYNRADTAASSMAQTTENLDKGVARVDVVMAALDQVMAGGSNLQVSFQSFDKEVDKTEEAAESVRSRAMAMKAKAQEHIDKWAKESQDISNDSLRAAADARRAKATSTFAQVTEAMQKAKASYQPFMSNLKDIRTYLASDLTPQSIQGARPMAQEAKMQAAKLKADIDGVKTAIGKMRDELVGPPPATK